MKYVQLFVSNTILFYLFYDADVGAPHAKIRTFSMYDNLEEYVTWAERRVEILFYDCTATNWSPAERIRRVDQRLLDIFPFLSRIVDRSYVLERFLTTLELFDISEEEKKSSPARASLSEAMKEEVESMPAEIPVEEAPTEVPIQEASQPSSPAPSLRESESASIRSQKEEDPSHASSPESSLGTPVATSPPPTPQVPRVVPSLSKALAAMTPATPSFTSRPTRPRTTTGAPSIHQLRRIATEAGVKGAYILTKKQLLQLPELARFA